MNEQDFPRASTVMDTPDSQAFIMHSAREAVAAGFGHIEEHIEEIEQAVVKNPGLAFDLAKVLIESVCRTILKEQEVPYSRDEGVTDLFRKTHQNLSFLPSTANNESDIRRSLEKSLSGLHSAIQGISELRNRCGFASHGDDGLRPKMEKIQALLVAEATDAIIGFLHSVHRRYQKPSPRFDDNDAFNNHVDEIVGPIHVLESVFRASEILFHMERKTYDIYLTEFDGNELNGKEET